MGRELDIKLKTFHPGQLKAYKIFKEHTYVSGCCGRRWGKTDFAQIIAIDYVIKGRSVGWFAPSHKILNEAYDGLVHTLTPITPKKNGASRMAGIIRTMVPSVDEDDEFGRIEFWSLENENAGRSRHYHLVIIDEAAFSKANMAGIWERAIEPTLLDWSGRPYGGKCLVISNANG